MPRPRYPGLTPREQEVYELLRGGLTNREIAERLGISLDGAKYHVSQILMKLDVSTREEAVALTEGRRTFGLAGLGTVLRELAPPGGMKTVAVVASSAVLVLVALLALIALVAGNRASDGALAIEIPVSEDVPLTPGGEASAFLAALEHIPARPNSSVLYTDYAAARRILGIQPPGPDADYGDLIDYWGALGKVGLFRDPIARELASIVDLDSELGFNLGSLDQGLYAQVTFEAGVGCSISQVFLGRFDEGRIENAIRETSSMRGAITRDVHNGVPYFSWPGPCAIFGDFGGPGSLVVGDDVVYWNGESHAYLEPMIDAAAGAMPSLAGTPAFQALAQSFADLGVISAGVEVYTDPLWFQYSRESAETKYGQEAVEAQGYLRPYIGVAMGAAYDSEGPHSVLIFLHDSVEAASANAAILRQKLDSGVSFATKRPWSEMISRSEVEVNGRVVQAKVWSDDPTLLDVARRNLDSLFVSRP